MSDASEVVDRMWSKLEPSADGQITLEQSLAFYTELRTVRTDLNLEADGHQAWFNGIGGEEDGMISKEEVIQYLVSKTEPLALTGL